MRNGTTTNSAMNVANRATPRAMQERDESGRFIKRVVTASFANEVTGAGGALPEDRSRYSTALRRGPLSSEYLEALYGYSLARRIVDRIPDDCVKEGFDFGKARDVPPAIANRSKEIFSWLETLNALDTLSETDKQARLYGGAVIVLRTRDSAAGMAQPLQLGPTADLESLEIVAAPDAQPESIDVRAGGRAMSNPERYRIYGSEIVHKSRVIRMDGLPVPFRMRRESNGWARSELDPIYDDLRRLWTIRAYMEALAHVVSMGILRVGGLGKALLAGGERKKKAMAAVRDLQRQADNLHWLALDREDMYEISSRPIRGLKDLDERCVKALVMATAYPREILENETPGGLNTGESAGPFRSYYDTVGARQRKRYTPALNRILEVLFAARRISVEEWTIRWLPLWSPTESEHASTEQIEVETAATQTTSTLAIINQVASGRIPRASGIALLTNIFHMDPATAEVVMGDVGNSFFSQGNNGTLPPSGAPDSSGGGNGPPDTSAAPANAATDAANTTQG